MAFGERHKLPRHEKWENIRAKCVYKKTPKPRTYAHRVRGEMGEIFFGKIDFSKVTATSSSDGEGGVVDKNIIIINKMSFSIE